MRQDSGIGVLDKAVGVLHAVAESPCGLAELCERTGLPRATAHRLAAGLEVHRLLARDACGPLAARPGAARTVRPGQRSAARRRRRRAAGTARDHRGERAAVPARGNHPGLRRRAGTACGPSRYRAGGGAAADDRRLGGQGAAGLQRYRATQQAVLPTAVFTERTLAEVRRRGWAQSAAEREPGVASVSAPVRDARRCGDRRGVGVGSDRPDGPAPRRALGRRSAGRQPTLTARL